MLIVFLSIVMSLTGHPKILVDRHSLIFGGKIQTVFIKAILPKFPSMIRE
jgi:hypothetical protein